MNTGTNRGNEVIYIILLSVQSDKNQFVLLRRTDVMGPKECDTFLDKGGLTKRDKTIITITKQRNVKFLITVTCVVLVRMFNSFEFES